MRTLTMRALSIPFKRSFEHASAKRSVTQSVWVKSGSTYGPYGYGEGCPREYVTGESIESALKFFQTVQGEAAALGDIGELRAWVREHRGQIDANPAAWCAIELSLLDLMAKEKNQTVEELLLLPALSGPFQYTAVLGAEASAPYEQQLREYIRLGFRDFKLKLSGEQSSDQSRLAKLITEAPALGSLRLDANNLWTEAETAIDYLRSLPGPCFAIEEPLGAGDYRGLGRIARTTGLKVILDESCLRLEQLDRLSSLEGSHWIINVRISKMGGLLRSLEIADHAAHLNLPLIVGCQVGETSLLTRAALTLARAVPAKNLVAQEGAFGTYLLAHDVVDRPLMFGREGRLEVATYPFLTHAGWGMDILNGQR